MRSASAALNEGESTTGPDLRGGQTGQLPRASTTRGPPQKTVKNYYLRKHKILFETDNLQ